MYLGGIPCWLEDRQVASLFSLSLSRSCKGRQALDGAINGRVPVRLMSLELYDVIRSVKSHEISIAPDWVTSLFSSALSHPAGPVAAKIECVQ